jgi:AcrR family transcriptional regulator
MPAPAERTGSFTLHGAGSYPYGHKAWPLAALRSCSTGLPAQPSALRRYRCTASGANTISIATDQQTTASSGCCIGQTPRRDRGLSRAEIIKAAIAVADAEGPEAISMRRIARELNAGAMSLYWYVGSKEELLDLMLDSIEAEIEVPEPSGDWRADLGAFAHRTRAAMSRHRWAMEFIGSRPPSRPNDVRNLERLLGLLDGTGVDDARVIMGIFMTVATFVTGAVMREAQEIRLQREQEQAEANLTDEEIRAERERYRKWFEASGRYPRITRLMESGIDPDDPATRDERFPVQPGLRARRHRRPADPRIGGMTQRNTFKQNDVRKKLGSRTGTS